MLLSWQAAVSPSTTPRKSWTALVSRNCMARSVCRCQVPLNFLIFFTTPRCNMNYVFHAHHSISMAGTMRHKVPQAWRVHGCLKGKHRGQRVLHQSCRCSKSGEMRQCSHIQMPLPPLPPPHTLLCIVDDVLGTFLCQWNHYCALLLCDTPSNCALLGLQACAVRETRDVTIKHHPVFARLERLRGTAGAAIP